MRTVSKVILSLLILLVVLSLEILFPIYLCYRKAIREYYLEWLPSDRKIIEEVYPKNEYFSNKPSWYSIEQAFCHIDTEYISSVENVLASTDIFHVRFKYQYSQLSINARDVYKFDVIESLSNKEKLLGERVVSYKEDNVFHSQIESMLGYYGVSFKRNEEYIIFCKDGNFIKSSFAIGYLDGIYPYIEVYPIRKQYDATYFGATDKNVTKEEFILLLSKEKNEIDSSNSDFYVT